jgi:dihydroneopterin aldolase
VSSYDGDIVFLSDLRVQTVIGIFEWERRIRQTVAIDLEMAHDLRAAARSDSIEDCLDYKAVAKRVIALVEESEFHLVEALADAVARTLITEFGLPWVRVTLNKPGAVRGSRDVGVRIERTTADYAAA